jgi:NADPH-dependent 2,4-dienoyl-CoA reductase/sulfur reductase-like enzyme
MAGKQPIIPPSKTDVLVVGAGPAGLMAAVSVYFLFNGM